MPLFRVFPYLHVTVSNDSQDNTINYLDQANKQNNKEIIALGILPQGLSPTTLLPSRSKL